MTYKHQVIRNRKARSQPRLGEAAVPRLEITMSDR